MGVCCATQGQKPNNVPEMTVTTTAEDEHDPVGTREKGESISQIPLYPFIPTQSHQSQFVTLGSSTPSGIQTPQLPNSSIANSLPTYSHVNSQESIMSNPSQAIKSKLIETTIVEINDKIDCNNNHLWKQIAMNQLSNYYDTDSQCGFCKSKFTNINIVHHVNTNTTANIDINVCYVCDQCHCLCCKNCIKSLQEATTDDLITEMETQTQTQSQTLTQANTYKQETQEKEKGKQVTTQETQQEAAKTIVTTKENINDSNQDLLSNSSSDFNWSSSDLKQMSGNLANSLQLQQKLIDSINDSVSQITTMLHLFITNNKPSAFMTHFNEMSEKIPLSSVKMILNEWKHVNTQETLMVASVNHSNTKIIHFLLKQQVFVLCFSFPFFVLSDYGCVCSSGYGSRPVCLENHARRVFCTAFALCRFFVCFTVPVFE